MAKKHDIGTLVNYSFYKKNEAKRIFYGRSVQSDIELERYYI
jgi:hypothetical protein